MRDSRKTREILKIGIAAGLIAVIGEMYIRPYVGKAVKR